MTLMLQSLLMQASNYAYTLPYDNIAMQYSTLQQHINHVGLHVIASYIAEVVCSPSVAQHYSNPAAKPTRYAICTAH